jgi:hypothetical protein
MSFISITAPVFTEEDERAERESMSPEESEEVRNDIHGINTFEATPEMVKNGPYELQLALDDIHEEEKEVLLEAMMLCPELVERESNYLMFLRSEYFNVWVSSRRIQSSEDSHVSFHKSHYLNQQFYLRLIVRGGTIAQVLGVSKVAIWRPLLSAHDSDWKWCFGRGGYCFATNSSYSLPS